MACSTGSGALLCGHTPSTQAAAPPWPLLLLPRLPEWEPHFTSPYLPICFEPLRQQKTGCYALKGNLERRSTESAATAAGAPC